MQFLSLKQPRMRDVLFLDASYVSTCNSRKVIATKSVEKQELSTWIDELTSF
jgi:hypothetical protein